MSLRSGTSGANSVDNQKKQGVLGAREPNTDLGQEAPILVDGTKTGPSTKGKRTPKENTTGNRSIFSPGPLAKSVGNLEDETRLVNPSTNLSRDSISQSKLELSAGENKKLNGKETAGILGPTADPLNKRPFPPVDWEKKEMSATSTKDMDVIEQGDDQEKFIEPWENQDQIKINKLVGNVEKLDGKSEQEVRLPALAGEELEIGILGSASPFSGKRCASTDNLIAAGQPGTEPTGSAIKPAAEVKDRWRPT